MTDRTVDVEQLGSGLAITIASPPVNAIGRAVRAELAEALAQVGDASFVVLRGAPNYFSAGADIGEIGASPSGIPLRELLREVEALACPVVALVDGAAMGGGMELALACDYRLATTRARFGLPEIKLGLVPGAGGTVRLLRLIGLRRRCG